MMAATSRAGTTPSIAPVCTNYF